jgi:cell division protein FtsL
MHQLGRGEMLFFVTLVIIVIALAFATLSNREQK